MPLVSGDQVQRELTKPSRLVRHCKVSTKPIYFSFVVLEGTWRAKLFGSAD